MKPEWNQNKNCGINQIKTQTFLFKTRYSSWSLKESARAGGNEEQVTALFRKKMWRKHITEHSRKNIGERRIFVASASRNSSVGSTSCTSSSAARLIAHNLMILGSTTSITYKRDCMSTWATNQNYWSLIPANVEESKMFWEADRTPSRRNFWRDSTVPTVEQNKQEQWMFAVVHQMQTYVFTSATKLARLYLAENWRSGRQFFEVRPI